MKANIESLLKARISDNKSFIKAYTETGNIMSYFAADIEQNPEEYLNYLTDDEIELYENNKDLRDELMFPVWGMLEKYNMPIDEYLGYEVEPAC